MEVCKYVQIGRDCNLFCKYRDEYNLQWQRENKSLYIDRAPRYIPFNCPPDAMTENGEPICYREDSKNEI
jgi:hypothetical protein